jgi:hypothetical protein
VSGAWRPPQDDHRRAVTGGPGPGEQVRWTYTTASKVFSSPAVADSAVYVGSDDDNVYALSAGPMLAAIVAANDLNSGVTGSGHRGAVRYA